MKIYIAKDRIRLVGKAWEVRRQLKEYSKQYETVQDWIRGERRKFK
ncbi:Z-ring formation inhibitor MciZ [Bacillus sp. 165]|nr:Z-ring formation inhibitor MciZ [Bacillus sp. 165]MBO9129796.1 Z-ring formation inhibitor MciZ [Bacillus sp. 165]